MVFKKFLSLSMLVALAAGAFAVSEQSAEAGRCCRQRCHRRCCGYGYTYAYAGNCNTCTTAPAVNQGTGYGEAPAPAPAPTTQAPPPAPAT